ncbi:hypothetical protein [Telmatospirillum siberiense]|uniref:Alpha-D-phosphohexomutase alpha/beta/alpha domain-containing protein n=1 Tax=Telmatospirillum siberiense TaxID=382514 RepID=A0A2N3PW78_9PROT|nr:hypothetical protein CWS72_09940 [Telmatospirillum siberiense]
MADNHINPSAGKPVEPSMLVNVPRLVTTYFTETADPTVPSRRVAFGTSGHRGSAFQNSFNHWHVLAISQAIGDYRKWRDIDGPLFLGIDTHALAAPQGKRVHPIVLGGAQAVTGDGIQDKLRHVLADPAFRKNIEDPERKRRDAATVPFVEIT